MLLGGGIPMTPRVLPFDPFDPEWKKKTSGTKSNLGTWSRFRLVKVHFSIFLHSIVFLLKWISLKWIWKDQKQTENPLDQRMLEEICSHLERISMRKIRFMPLADEYTIKIGSFYSKLHVDYSYASQLIDYIKMGQVMSIDNLTLSEEQILTSILNFFFKGMLLFQSNKVMSIWKLDYIATFSEHFILFFLQIFEIANRTYTQSQRMGVKS